MPTEREILAAGPLSPDDPQVQAQVQAALKKLSARVLDGLRRLEEHARTPAAEHPPEKPPPEKARGAPRSKREAPQPSSSTTTSVGHHTKEGVCATSC